MWIRVTWALSGLVIALTIGVVVSVLLTATDSVDASSVNFVPPALTALAAFIVIFGVGAFIQRADLALHKSFPWLVAAASFLFSTVPLWLLSSGHGETAAMLYRGLHIPQGIERFWDLALVLRSIDCSAVGVDVFAEHNGCLADPAIYGPGMLWFKYLPFGLASFSHVLLLGVAMIILSSVALMWLARESTGFGQIVLLIAAVGGPWLLLLERGNIDAALIWVAIAAVIIVRRWPTLLSWSIVALLIWLVGTWKYYPFAMGILLVPVLRLRRGWILFVVWVAACVGFVLLTWSNFKFSMQSNSNMTEISDSWVLGRVPVVARMIGSAFPSTGIQLGDVVVGLLALTAIVWGVILGARVINLRPVPTVHPAMLAAAGSAIFLASVLVGGFGWAYKATFLLLCVPLLSWLTSRIERIAVFSGLITLILIGLCSVVAWNTVLATLAGVISASFALGLSCSFLYLFVAPRQVTSKTTASQ